MSLIEEAGTRKSMHNLNSALSYFSVCINGRTKGQQVSGSKFFVPCVEKTNGTGLEPGLWTQRLIDLRKEMKMTGGRLLQRNLTPPRLAEFEEDFYTVLEKVQAGTNAISDDVEVREAFGILRSLRKGNAAHALNMDVPEALIFVRSTDGEERSKLTLVPPHWILWMFTHPGKPSYRGCFDSLNPSRSSEHFQSCCLCCLTGGDVGGFEACLHR
jgi:hypothetical protein